MIFIQCRRDKGDLQRKENKYGPVDTNVYGMCIIHSVVSILAGIHGMIAFVYCHTEHLPPSTSLSKTVV